MNDLELLGVGKTYRDGTIAVANFDLQVKPGEFVAFLGPSGCGKSTTLRMIAGFEDITHGRILIKGKDVSRTPPEARPTSMIFQNYALFPHMSVRENVAFGLDIKRMDRRQRDNKVDRILDMFGLSAYADRKANNLSGGQRQRIALARGLVVEPQILLLDEPLGALDANLRRIIQNELKLLQRELGITFVFVTHAQSEALGLSDRVVVMSNGVVEQISTPRDLYNRPSTAFVAQFIGSNAIFAGSGFKAGLGSDGSIETPLGRITGTLGAAIGDGQGVLAVIPAEAIQIEAETAASNDNSGNPRLSGEIAARQIVGSIGHFRINLSSGAQIAIEAHVNRPGIAALEKGNRVAISLPEEKVTLVPAAR
ncbi:ABC transporter ATP-binding protein [Devosia sp.]|uniref:ABC transporter ATP-binding protein n=1 Tax=Devosia sp. TaxID=1871048 RepID=UPI002735F4EB|nr:ABC transporter ATP-binding protein [Devosia sp.]MDP2780352.1 ABC transporter ATP-binding protein [Devosia sp.]